MRSLKTIYQLCLFYFVSSQFNEEISKDKLQEIHPHSLYPPFVNGMEIDNWDFGGDTIIDTYSHMRLTPDQSSKSGYLWSKDFLPTTNWQVEFKFKVGGINKGLSGDGFAFWAAKDRTQPGPVFGSKDYFNGLGIFFDTFHNAMTNTIEFPYISAMIGDGNQHYDNDQDGKPTEKSGCSYDFKTEDPMKARITYVKGTSLELRLQKEGQDQWTTCFAIPNIKLPDGVYLGFTALTGELHDKHDIYSITTRVADNIGNYRADFTTPVVKYKSSWGKIFLIFVVSGVIGLVYMGYQAQQKKARKRF